jgi:GH24 family phage-related lysozyme (muramidase)
VSSHKNTMKISAAGLDFIEDNEGFRPLPYLDNGTWAWGYGHDQKPGETKPLKPLTEGQAGALLIEDVAHLEAWLSNYETTLSQKQFDALVDFGYNAGLGALQTMLAHGLAEVPNQIPRWDFETIDDVKVQSAGLAMRRAKEVTLFNT